MIFKFKTIILFIFSFIVSFQGAWSEDKVMNDDYFAIKKVTIKEITSTAPLKAEFNKELYVDQGPTDPVTQADPIERAGRVIQVAKDLVALGEDLYRLVIKGKPTNTTTYAPISVVPKVNGSPVDLMETEDWQMPVKRSYEISYENYLGIEIVYFRYSVIFSYGGSYDGKGAYLTAVQVIPEQVMTLFGFDFTATMKLGGIQNQGTRKNPIAGATILLEHTVSSILATSTVVDPFYITGSGAFKKY